ncbi:tumor necrosis factor receptor superfamily member 13C isoform X2 [Rissa tridactyla]|uniref:tumor necrosis factor receptor superfamily member 13C isoform X2 n=1 Tax=Rissa tridactyla TaxID=75485 RepID=UPI0023BAA79D|nr:tumor necrosis factor receptor superfamily member 13C isoform X2 [Rissa tridactyla]
MGGNRVRSVTTMRLQHPSTQQDPGARYLQEDITAAIPGLPTKHSQLQVFTPGKAAAPSPCLSSQCFDLLTRSCVQCSDLFKENAKPARMAPTSPLVPTLPSVDLPSTLLIFGVPAVVGLILALAALWGFLACKVGKQRRKRKAADEEAKANTDAASPLPEPGCQDAAVPEGDAILATAPCPHHNGGLKMAGPPGKAGAKRRPCCQGDADGDIILLSAVYSQHEECNHSFPLPATELGATALVTTKTTQNCSSEERA